MSSNQFNMQGRPEASAVPCLGQAALRRHVAVFAFPFSSHPSTLLALTRRLATASPPTTTFSFISTEKSNSALFPSSPNADPSAFLNILRFNVHDGLPEGYVTTHDPKTVGGPLEPVDLFMRAAPENIRKAAEAAEEAVGCRISCVVSDAFLWLVADLAEERGAPWVAVLIGGPRPLVALVEVDLIRSTIGDAAAGCEDKIIDFIPGFSSTKCRDLPEGIVFGNFDSPFNRMLHRMAGTLHRANAVVVNSFEEADPVVTRYLHSKFQKHLSVGPFILASPQPFSDPHGCIPWLDRHEPSSVVYISFGTVIKPKPCELMALMESLIETGHPFLWSFRGSLMEQNFPADIVEKVLERGKLVPWAPQLAVLRHGSVGVFVTHCGWNSLVESIAGGVPMIGRPFFGDQQLNRSTMEDEWRIGVGVEGGTFTREGTVRALGLIMSREEGKKMREVVGVLKEAALKSMQPGGSSTKNFNCLMEVINK